MSRVEVAPASELSPGERTIVDTDTHGEIGVLNVEGDYYAVKNECPHRGGPVCDGKVSKTLVGEWEEVGDRPVTTFGDDPAISCSWHGWDFNLTDGSHVGLDSIKVPTYDVVVEDDTVYLDL